MLQMVYKETKNSQRRGQQRVGFISVIHVFVESHCAIKKVNIKGGPMPVSVLRVRT